MKTAWTRRSFLQSAALATATVLTIAACGGNNQSSSGGGSQPVEVTLVSYAVTQAAYEQIIPKFAAQWKEKTGQEVRFNQSYGGSGSQTRAVIDGLEADVVALALESDINQIEKAGLIKSGWQQRVPNNGIITNSVVALVTQEGNPKGIKDWSDLIKPDVRIVTANPKTSGGARWNFLAAWGSVTQTGGTPEKALEFTTALYKNVPILAKDARESTDVFTKGQADVLLNYENELILAQQKGQQVDYAIPSVNINIEGPVAVVDTYVDKRGTREVSEAFVQFLFTPEAQAEFAKVGFRPAVPEGVDPKLLEAFPKIQTWFTVADLGGWAKVQPEFFGDGGIFDKVQQAVAGR
ncbi:sulfate ABC transporter substrate-binding protein [Synechococcus elongatus IITB4]|uniref:sulfate ABC transporter substrate-binding protein n=1 Tax=Synechococcus elongatus TaxID=32046 RepID=UPI0030D1D0DC